MVKTNMGTNAVTPDNTPYPVWLKQLGVAAVFALLLYISRYFFEGNVLFHDKTPIFDYFEIASGFALVVLLLGGKRYVWGIFIGAALIETIMYGSILKGVIYATGDSLQALCGVWLLARSGKFDLRLQSLRDYLLLILLGGCASIAAGALFISMALLFSGWITAEQGFHTLRHIWLGDTLGVVLATPLILTWRQTKESWRKSGQLIEAFLLLGMTVLLGQIVFLGWLHYGFIDAPKGYWMFLPITWVAIRLGSRGTSFALFVVALQALFGAIHGTGYFANDVAQTHLLNYFVYTLTLSIVGMALAAHLTERKIMEADLQSREASLRAILDNFPYMAWLKNTEGRYLMANIAHANYARLKDYSEIIGKTDFDLWPKELAEKYRADDAEIIATRQQRRVEEPSFDGETTHWVETYKTPIIDKRGNVLGTVGFACNITERKQVEEALRIAAIAFETQEGLTVTDAHSVILRVNKAFTAITGYTTEEAIGKTPRLLKSGKHDAAFYTAMWESINRTGMWKGEIWNRRKNGEISRNITPSPP